MQAVRPYYFRRGAKVDSPILLPLPSKTSDLRVVAQFCHRISPGAPLIVPNFDHLGEPRLSNSLAVADRLGALIADVVQAHSLSLVPIVVVGDAEGADLGAQLILMHGSFLGAGILLRPNARLNATDPGILDGIHVLLGRSASEEAVGTVGWHIADVMRKGGAEVICERVLQRRVLGAQEAALGRVFVAALFGA